MKRKIKICVPRFLANRYPYKLEFVSLFFFQFKEVSYENAFAPKSFIMISSIRFPNSDGYEN